MFRLVCRWQGLGEISISVDVGRECGLVITVHLEGFPGLRADPFAVDVRLLNEERLVV